MATFQGRCIWASKSDPTRWLEVREVGALAEISIGGNRSSVVLTLEEAEAFHGLLQTTIRRMKGVDSQDKTS